MVKFGRPLLLSIFLLALLVLPAAAQSGSGIPVADTFVWAATSTTGQDGNDLLIEGSADPSGACTPRAFIYLKWDLSTHTTPVSGAVLKLTTSAITSQAGGRTLTLYRVADTWTEAITWNDAQPALGTALQPLVLPASIPAGMVITFDAPGITTYINEQIGNDNTVSFALAFSTCSASSLQGFHDSESGASLSPRLEAPNAVALRELSAQQTNSLPLYVGLGALALVAVAGVGMSRRRTAAR